MQNNLLYFWLELRGTDCCWQKPSSILGVHLAPLSTLRDYVVEGEVESPQLTASVIFSG